VLFREVFGSGVVGGWLCRGRSGGVGVLLEFRTWGPPPTQFAAASREETRPKRDGSSKDAGRTGTTTHAEKTSLAL